MSNELPPAVNWHLIRNCTMKCRYCFGRFLDAPKPDLVDEPSRAVRLIASLAHSFEKITLTGGEPLLCQSLEELAAVCKLLDRTVMVVSNGSPLVRDPSRIRGLSGVVDWFGLSVDSAVPELLNRLGRCPRGGAITPSQYIVLSQSLRRAGIRLKINVVVTRLNKDEDLRWFLDALRPERIKLFQVMPIRGQNDRSVSDLLVTTEEFAAFVERNRKIDIPVVAESNQLMSGSYAMLDPTGRFFDNTTGRHRYSQPVLDVGVEEAFAQISFDARRFSERGGFYDWR